MEPSIYDVSAFVLETKDRMTTMKLQKLCYYIQAWHLAENNKRLFSGNFQAWANGPVSRELYDAHKGKYSIEHADISHLGDSSKLSRDQKKFITIILEDYEPLTAAQLSALTHNESPWLMARKGLMHGMSSSDVISEKSIVQYYSSLKNDKDASEIDKIDWPNYLISAE